MEDQASVKLDEEFKNNLKFIRPYIIKLTNPKYISSCRVWLEKMSTCEHEDKAIRNEYLKELARQIQNGAIEEPFISTPPEGPLIELNVVCASNSWSDLSTVSTATEIPGSGDSHTDHIITEDKNSSPNIYESKIKEQQILIDELKQTNEILNDRLDKCEAQLNARNSRAEIGINMLASEVDYLRERLKELIVMKRNLQSSHNAIILQWQESSHSLEAELLEEKQKNSTLEMTIQELKNNIEVSKSDQEVQTTKNVDDKLLIVYHEEICNIQEKHSEVIKYIEEKHSRMIQNKEDEYDATIRDLRYSYEQKIEEISTEAEKNYKFKDKEISRLEKLVEIQCDNRSQVSQDCSVTNDALLEKISFLQSCILKMEKLLRKYEKHYSRKMQSLIKELQMKENTMQIQLTTQRAQLLARASSERQKEIEDVVSQLEQRYRLLLEDQQSQVTDIRQEYSHIITKLSEKFEVKSNTTA